MISASILPSEDVGNKNWHYGVIIDSKTLFCPELGGVVYITGAKSSRFTQNNILHFRVSNISETYPETLTITDDTEFTAEPICWNAHDE